MWIREDPVMGEWCGPEESQQGIVMWTAASL
jgi:hypothetical protein